LRIIDPIGEEDIMNRLGTLTLSTLSLLFLGVALPSGEAIGQEKTLKEQIVGTWTYVSVDTVRPDGSRVPMYVPIHMVSRSLMAMAAIYC
jgi:hypothetical protein